MSGNSNTQRTGMGLSNTEKIGRSRPFRHRELAWGFQTLREVAKLACQGFSNTEETGIRGFQTQRELACQAFSKRDSWFVKGLQTAGAGM